MTRLFPLAGCALALVGCSGGSDAVAPPTENVTGYWQVYLTPTGSTTETGPTAVYLSQTGAAIIGAGTIGTMIGNAFTLVTDGGTFTATFNGTASGNSASGLVSFAGSLTGTGTHRLAQFTPTGSIGVSGTIGTELVDLQMGSAIGSRDYSDVALTVLEEVELIAADVSEQFEVAFSAAGLAVGTLSVPGTVTATVLLRRGSTVIETAATSGTLTVTQYDANGFAGSFTLTLAAGGTIAAAFDVSFDIAAYDP